jgi:hypothetical protein
MEKTMEHLTLRTDDKVIWIDQYIDETIGHQSIAVSTDQVPLVIEWLPEASKELQSKVAGKLRAEEEAKELQSEDAWVRATT